MVFRETVWDSMNQTQVNPILYYLALSCIITFYFSMPPTLLSREGEAQFHAMPPVFLSPGEEQLFSLRRLGFLTRLL